MTSAPAPHEQEGWPWPSTRSPRPNNTTTQQQQSIKGKKGRKEEKGVINPKAVSASPTDRHRLGQGTPSRAAQSVREKDGPVEISQAIIQPVTVEATQRTCNSRHDTGGIT